MSTTIHEEGSGAGRGPIGLRDAVDRWGADLSAWPDAALARHAREALLSDRSFRAYWDEAGAMTLRLAAASHALDGRIADSGAAGRIARAVLAEATLGELPALPPEMPPEPRIAVGSGKVRTAAVSMDEPVLPARAREGSAFRRHRLAAVAAAVVIAAGLGSASRLLAVGAEEPSTVEIVQLDSLLFGPSEAGF